MENRNELLKKLYEACDVKEVQTILQEAGKDADEETAKQLFDEIQKHKKGEAVNDGDLEKIAGGEDYCVSTFEMDGISKHMKLRKI